MVRNRALHSEGTLVEKDGLKRQQAKAVFSTLYFYLMQNKYY
jgi:hypothetical protein